MLRRFVLVAALVSLISGGETTAQHKKIRLAVAPFTSACPNLPRDSKVGDGIADMIITELFKLNMFDIIERSRLDKIMAEKNLAQTDLVEADPAVRAAKILNCDALVIGSITEYSVVEKRTDLGFMKSSKQVYTVGLQFRIVDIATGRTRLSTSAVGSVEKKGGSLDVGAATSRWAGVNVGKVGEGERAAEARFSEAAQEAVEKLVAQMKYAFPPEGYVIKVDGDTVYIDLGKVIGVHKGDRFRVVRVGENITHPVTGKVLEGESEEIGEVEVKKVIGDELSTCEICSGKGKVEAGQKIIGIVQALAGEGDGSKN